MPLFDILEIDLHDKAHLQGPFGIFQNLQAINILILMITLSALDLQVVDNLLFYLGLALVPHIRTKHRNQHAAINANSKQNGKRKEKDHRDGVGAHCHYKTFISGVVVTNVKQCHECAFEGGELPGLAAEESVSKNSKSNKDGAEGYK